MTEEQRALLNLAAPNVVVKAYEGHPNHPSNRAKRVADECVAKGWLEYVADQDRGRSVHRITAAGANARAKRRSIIDRVRLWWADWRERRQIRSGMRNGFTTAEEVEEENRRYFD